MEVSPALHDGHGASYQAVRFGPKRSRRRSTSRRLEERDPALAADRRDHLSTVSRIDRLSRAASLRVRAARAQRPERRRDRRGGGWAKPIGPGRVCRSDERGVRQHRVTARPRRMCPHSGQRLARPLSGHPRERRADAGRKNHAPCQSPNRAAQRRVLRGRARLPSCLVHAAGVIDVPAQDHVKSLLRGFMDTWIAKQYEELRRIEQEGVSPSGILAPFHDALVPGIRGLGERGFSTALGNLHERIALVIGESVHEEAQRAFDLSGNLPVLTREFITQRIGQLASGAAAPDHAFERQQLLNAFGAEVPEATRIDLYVKTRAGEWHYFEMKSAKPNKGQCIEMKQRLLTALAIRRQESTRTWWGVPYNPYGRGEYRWVYPLVFFDFEHEVMLGLQFWDFVGGTRTYEELLDLYRQVGDEFAERIRELREIV